MFEELLKIYYNLTKFAEENELGELNRIFYEMKSELYLLLNRLKNNYKKYSHLGSLVKEKKYNELLIHINDHDIKEKLELFIEYNNEFKNKWTGLKK